LACLSSHVCGDYTTTVLEHHKSDLILCVCTPACWPAALGEYDMEKCLALSR